MAARTDGIVTLPAFARDAIEAARRAEREQTILYRALAAAAEERGDVDLAERVNGLLADEQHHYSRLSARLMELGENPPDNARTQVQWLPLDKWEALARERERAEVARYETLLGLELDARTREMITEILASERRHLAELGGKWMEA